MGSILSHRATWFVLGVAAMYFAYPYVSSVIPFGAKQGS